jgi:hypothetical protein
MQLNRISLSDDLLVALYGSKLVIPSEASEPAEPAAAAATALQYLGKNNRRFVILVNYPDQLHLPDDSFQFLGSILKACQLNAADVAIVNVARQDVSLPMLQEQLNPALLVSFGEQCRLPGFPETAALSPADNGPYLYMRSPELEYLNSTAETVKAEKKQLWDGLKKMLQL